VLGSSFVNEFKSGGASQIIAFNKTVNLNTNDYISVYAKDPSGMSTLGVRTISIIAMSSLSITKIQS
jgi:hypothetical protein